MSSDFYQAGRPLSRVGLFQLITDEVFKDGLVEDWENSALNKLGRFLKVDAETARVVARRSASRFRKGELGSHRPMNVVALYERALYFVWSDGRVDPGEKVMLAGLRTYFNLSDEKHEELLARVRAPGYAEGVDPELAPISCFDLPVAAAPAAPFAEPPNPPSSSSPAPTSSPAPSLVPPPPPRPLPPPSRDEFDALAAPVGTLVTRSRDGVLDDDDGARAVQLAQRLRAGYEALPERRRPALALASRLAPALVLGGGVGALEALLTAMASVDDRWDEGPEHYAAVFGNCLAYFALVKRPGPAEELVGVAVRGASGHPGASYRWTALAECMRQAAAVAADAGQWETHDRILTTMAAVPPSAVAAVPSDWARCVGSWLGRVAREGRVGECWRGLEAFLEVVEHLEDREVRREYATALGAVILVIGGSSEPDPPGLEALAEDLADLAARFTGDRVVASLFASVAGPLTTALVTAQAAGAYGPVAEALDRVAARYAADPEIRDAAAAARARLPEAVAAGA